MERADVLLYAVGRLIPAALGIGTLAVFTSFATPAEYGRYAVIVAWQGLGCTILIHHLNYSLPRFWNDIESTRERDELVATVVALSLVGLAALGCLAIVLKNLGMLSAPEAFALFALGGSATARTSIQEMVRASLRARLHTWNRICLSVVVLISGGALLVSGEMPASFAMMAGLFVGDVVVVGLTVFVCRSSIRIAVPRRGLAKRLLAFGLPVNATTVSNQLTLSGLRIAIEHHLGPGAAGIYSASLDLAQKLMTLTMQVPSLAIMPHFYRAVGRGDDSEQRRLLSRLAIYSAALGGGVLGATSFHPGSLGTLALGAEFVDGVVMCVPWLALGTFIIRMKTNVLDVPLLVERRVTAFLVQALASGVVVIVGMVWLVDDHGIPGALVTFGAAYATQALLSVLMGGRPKLQPHVGAWLIKVMGVVSASVVLSKGVVWPMSSELTGARLGSAIPLAAYSVALVLGYFLIDIDGIRGTVVRWIRGKRGSGVSG